MNIVGVSAYYHDSAACLVRDGDIVAAAQEERFTRKKHDPGFPHRAIDYCLQAGGIRLKDVSHLVFYDKPLVKFERILETYLAFAPTGLRVISRSDACMDERETLPQEPSARRVSDAWRGNDKEGIASYVVLRAPRVTCCVRVLPIAI